MLHRATIVEVLYETDYPEIVVARDGAGYLYLSVFSARTPRGDQFLCVPISATKLVAFRKGKVDLRELLDKPESIAYSAEFYRDGATQYLHLEPLEDVPPEWLPESGFLLVDLDEAALSAGKENATPVAPPASDAPAPPLRCPMCGSTMVHPIVAYDKPALECSQCNHWGTLEWGFEQAGARAARRAASPAQEATPPREQEQHQGWTKKSASPNQQQEPTPTPSGSVPLSAQDLAWMDELAPKCRVPFRDMSPDEARRVTAFAAMWFVPALTEVHRLRAAILHYADQRKRYPRSGAEIHAFGKLLATVETARHPVPVEETK